jgi:trans-aconitate methyltransferase
MRFYETVNRALVRRTVDLLPASEDGGALSVVDLGCGTGTLVGLLAEELRDRGLDATITGREPSSAALATARRRLAGAAADLRLVQGDAAELADLAPVDAVFFANAIHLVEDKGDVVERLMQVLAPGGLFATNSAFFTGAYAPGTERFYRLWTARALRHLREQHPDVRLARGQRAAAMNWLTPEDYEELLRRSGFELVHRSLDEVEMTLRSFQDIGRYRMFIEGALPGAPLAAGAEALGQGAAQAFEEMALRSVPRRWLQLVARAAPR